MATCPSCRTRYPDDVHSCANDGEALLPDAAFTGLDPELRPGDMVGEYKIESKIGEGGFGAVYRAVHPLIGKTAAIKVLNRAYSSNPQMVSRFIAEARAVNQIRHRNIIDIFAFGAMPDGRQYFVMELLEGLPFDRYVEEKKHLSPEEALPILRAVARALDAAHGHGVVHRDLKPENIFLVFDDEGRPQPKLLDFGIAKLMADGASGGHKTRTGAPMGTPNYMSPEQCRGQSIDHRTDIYSFGCVCHQVLTGKLPFDGEAVMDILVRHMTVAAPPMSSQLAEVDPRLDAPVLRMLEKDPDARPPSVGAAIDALTNAAREAGYSVPAVPVAATPTSGSNVSGRPGAATPRLPSTGSNRNLSPSQVEVAHAQTMEAGADPLGKTLLPAETDVVPGPRRTKLVVAALAGSVVVAAAAVLIVTRVGGTPTSAGTSAPATAAPTSSTTASAATASPQLTAGSPSSTASVSSSAPADPAEVEVTVDATPPTALVFLGAKKLGAASSPIKLPFGKEKVSLTVKADGYTAANVDVVPSASQRVSVKLVATFVKPRGPGTDLEKEKW